MFNDTVLYTYDDSYGNGGNASNYLVYFNDKSRVLHLIDVKFLQ